MYTYLSGSYSYKEPIKKECIVLVGLPARGKSYISKILCRYLNWNGYTTKIFNAGSYRRRLITNTDCTSEFFDPNNEECCSLRNELAILTLTDLFEWLQQSDSRIGIFDATNTTVDRRKSIYDLCSSHNIRVFFIESICNDKDIVERIIRNVKLESSDYLDKNPQQAFDDFKRRICNYEKVYKEISITEENHYSFIKIFNTGTNYFINKLAGYIQPKIAYYLMHTHLLEKTIYITRHGESEYNLEGKIGGDSNLSENGLKYSKLLGEFIKSQNKPHLTIWTSNLKRTIQTATYVCAKRHELKALDEIDAGVCENMTYNEIAEKFPEEYQTRFDNKFHYRYPSGESYVDVINRLETVILELERKKDILIITHQAVARCILAYLCDINSQLIPYIDVPLHTVFAITPKSHSSKVTIYTFDVNKENNPTNVENRNLSILR